MNAEDHEDPADYFWDNSKVIEIVLNRTSIAINPSGAATVHGSKVTITTAGTYRINGSLTDGQVIVDTNDEETVRLILNGVNINCSTSAPIYVRDAEKVVIVLQENTENYVADGATYILEVGTDEPNAAVFSKSDLTICGAGSLNVDANYNDGIASKDGLIIKNCTINVSSVDDGIRGKDYLVVRASKLTLSVGGDGLKSDNADDVTRGYISVDSGMINIACGGDAVQAATDVIIAGGEITLTSGGGSNGVIGAGVSAKGLKANVSITVDGGAFVISSADDAINSNGNVTINGGVFTMSTGDDGVHANTYLEINSGDINVTKCFEGLESAVITINDGIIYITAADDGINIAGGNDGGRADPFAPPAEGQWLHIRGGYIVVSAVADGIDTNGYMDMSGGIVIINGPTEPFNAAIDYGSGSFKLTGGTLVAVGSSGMAQAPSPSSTQCSVMVNVMSPRQAGTLFHIQIGEVDVVTFRSTKRFQSVVFSSPALTLNSTYSVYFGGISTGTVKDGLYTGGTYSGGTFYRNFIISNVVTVV